MAAGVALTDVTIRNIREKFFAMEEQEDLFDLQLADGTHFWDVVRLTVFVALYSLLGGPYVPPSRRQKPSLRERIKDVARGLVNAATLRYLSHRCPEYIFITGQRIRVGTDLVDNISDHLVAQFGDRAVAIETMNRDAIHYGRILAGGPTRVPPPRTYATESDPGLEGHEEALASIIERHFGARLDVKALVGEPISHYRQYRRFFDRLFRRHRPKAIVLINDGSHKGLFAAARSHDVPTIELQHGACSADNPFWSYPPSIRRTNSGLVLPTAYFTFSDYWRTNTNYPVQQSWAIGNDFFHQDPNKGDDRIVVIISAYMYHEALRDLTLMAAQALPDRRFQYKLHPHQYAKKHEIAGEFAEASNVAVLSDEITVQDLFRDAGFVVGVHSTLLYTALQAGKRVCIYKRDNYFWHEDIYDYVELFEDARELEHVIRNYTTRFLKLPERPSLFDSFDVRKFEAALAHVTGTAA